MPSTYWMKAFINALPIWQPKKGKFMTVPANNAPTTNAPVEPVQSEAQPQGDIKISPDGKIAAEVNVPKKMYKVKVNGQDMEIDEQELLTGYQTRKASDEKFREAAMSKKQAEEFINLLRTNPLKVLTNPALSIDMRKVAEDYLIQQMEEESMTPEQKELKEARSKLQSIEDEKKEQERVRNEQAAQELKQRYTESYTKDITSALESSGLPRTEHTVKKMAYYMHQALQRGYDLSASDVAELVRQDYINEQKSLFGSLDGEMLIKLLGDDVANKIRKHDVSKIKNVEKQVVRPQTQSQSSSKKVEKKVSMDEWRKRMDELKK